MSPRTVLLGALATLLLATTVPLRDGQPLLRWQDLMRVRDRGVAPILERAQEAAPALPAGKVTTYRWRDANGVWQLSNTPPPSGVRYETVEVRPGEVSSVRGYSGK